MDMQALVSTGAPLHKGGAPHPALDVAVDMLGQRGPIPLAMAAVVQLLPLEKGRYIRILLGALCTPQPNVHASASVQRIAKGVDGVLAGSLSMPLWETTVWHDMLKACSRCVPFHVHIKCSKQN